jgi:hypothetical protein
VVVREGDRSRLSGCSYLVDVYCLGVKNTIGPHAMSSRAVASFVEKVFSSFGAAPVRAPLELAQHLVLGAVEYARRLGFEPHPDFADTVDYLGQWKGPSAITFGRDGTPMFIQGPHDDPRKIIKTLERTAGRGKFTATMRF